MKRPKTQMARRPRMASGAAAKTSKEAAISLVRLEFDAARLQMGIDQAKNRAESYRYELTRNHQRKQALIDLLKR